MRKIIINLTLTFLPFILFSQNQGKIWYFGNTAGLNFNTNPPTALTNGQMSTNEGCATICDTAGQLIFYTDGISVWNKNHVKMPNGQGGASTLGGDPSSTQSGIIVPYPGQPNKYIIFTTSAYSNSNAKYSVVDISLNSGLGDVELSSRATTLLNGVGEVVQATISANGNFWWIVVLKNNSNSYYAYKLTSTGVDINNPVISNAGTSIPTAGCIGYLKFNGANNKMVRADYFASYFEIFDFNSATGVISNPIKITQTSAYGAEFSPNGRYLYISGIPGTLTQYDLNAGTTASAISASAVNIGASASYGAIQSAADGKLYVCVIGASSLGVISSPNSSGIASNYNSTGQSLGGRTATLGLPNIISSFVSTGPPVLNNLNVSNITGGGANLSANVASDGGSVITTRGFYYGTSSNPTTNLTTVTGTTGSMSTSISGLTPGTLYFYRAYATNVNGTTSIEDTFSTMAGNASPTISSISNLNNCEGGLKGNINFTVNDVETPDSLLLIAVTSSNTQLLPLDSINISGNGSTRVFNYSTKNGVYDSSIITITVTDTSGSSNSTIFTINIKEDKINTSLDTVQISSGGTFVVIDSLITINETNTINGSKVLISEGFSLGDVLEFNGILPSGINQNYNASTGVLSFNGNINPADLQNIFRNVQIKTTSSNGQNRRVTFMIGSAIPYGQNNHYYEFVTNQGISFTNAKTAAENLTFYGLKGYLATITSQAENQFVVSKLQGQGWFGASDAASEGVWKWVSGPEAGSQFWQGGINGSIVGGLYNNWQTGEPNNCCGGENYIHFLTNGKWNDYPLSLSSIQGYVVEYGGMPGDGCVKLTANKMVKVTLNVAPTITSISNQEVCFNDTLNNINFTVNDLNNDVNTLIISATSSNTNIIDASNINITSSGGNKSLRLFSNIGSTGTSTITITVEDSYGASSSTSFDVTVQDIVNPTAITKNITVALDNFGNVSITPSMINDGSNDNCKLDSLSVSQIAFNCSHLGTNQVILTAYDLFGNTDTAFAIITVISNDIDTDNDGMKDNCDDDDDNDGLTDLEEISKGSDSKKADSDGDGLTDGQEVKFGTDPMKKDTDGDGVNDGQEVKDNTDPLDPCASLYNNKTEDYTEDFLNGDCDKDGIRNGDEIGPNRNIPFDANNNGIPDYLEFNNFVEGTAADSLEIYNALSTNGDGLNDVLVIRNVNLYPDNNIVIYNKWGVVIYQATGYGQNNKFFRGKVNTNGKDEETVSTGTYYYVFKYKDKNNLEKTVVGYLYISN